MKNEKSADKSSTESAVYELAHALIRYKKEVECRRNENTEEKMDYIL